MTLGQSASRNRSTMRLAPLLSRTAQVKLGDRTASGDGLIHRLRVVLGQPEAAGLVPVGAQVSEDSVVLVAPLGDGLDRGLV